MSPSTPTPGAAPSAVETLAVPAATLAKARANLTSGDVVFLVVSGWMGSGKDTVAPAALAEAGHPDAEHLYYAKPLKTELDAILADIRDWFFTARFPAMTQRRRVQLAELLAERHEMSVQHAMFFVGRLLDQARMNPRVHARSRTPIVRTALQRLGTDVRRAQDPDYWVKQALAPAVETLAAGRSVYFTDARFPNEVSNAAALGAFTTRLDISREVQSARLRSRDNLTEVDPAQLFHASETALDDYPGFDVRVNNEGTLAEALAAIGAAWAPAALTA